jgi:hypothetical protein
MADKNVMADEQQKEGFAAKQLGRSRKPDSAEKEAKRAKDGNAAV